MVDMSATLLHHGHVRLIKEAAKHGEVIVALTSDEEIIKHKGYAPELDYESRKEIISSIRHVSNVVPSNWLIDEGFLNVHKIDFLVHGSDNSNQISNDRLIILSRTLGISSSILRGRVLSSISQLYLSRD
ncbi:adenylyltransferase/cytidyltransferase family protein [Porticoccaceae bacterium]|jgi:glycerol-3-phosphate cytidylyltransferase|nr:adenylyltransferase/cytidyltransferase family protein [Porticoccaceae bacterium]